MKKALIKFSAAAICLSSLLSISASAESGHGWYIVKRGQSTPGFPIDSASISQHSCYYIDEKSAECGEKVIYLTFDAGYENGNIGRILDTLKSENISAAFFILSNLIRKNTELVERMFEEGHAVCNHTANHKNLTCMCNEEIERELAAVEELCLERTGRSMSKYFRYPEGYYNEASVLTLEGLGYKTFFWSMAYADWDNAKQPDGEAAIKKLCSITHPGAIVLLHPTSETNAEILPRLIRAWRDMGYRFGTLDELVARTDH